MDKLEPRHGTTRVRGRRGALAATGFALAAMLSSAAGAAELRISLGIPESSPYFAPLTGFSEALSKAGIESKVFTTTLLQLNESSNGLRDGLADAAFVPFPYFPNEFSEVNLLANLSMLATSGTEAAVPGAAMAGASIEYTLLHCPDCLAQFAAQNQVYIAGGASAANELLCTSPVTDVADMAGKRIRAGAGNFTRVVEYVGGSALAISGTETYSAMEKGVVDCAVFAPTELIGVSLIDVTKAVTLGFPGGIFSGSGLPNFNREVWAGFTPEQRAAVFKAAGDLVAGSVVGYHRLNEEALEAARAKGIEILEASPALRAKLDEFVAADLLTVEKQFTEQYGVQNVGAKIALAQELVEKWKALTRDAGDDVGKLSELYWSEIFSKVDPATYGVN